MGSYKWCYKPPNMRYNYIVMLLITPLITTHEPPSMCVCIPFLDPKTLNP